MENIKAVFLNLFSINAFFYKRISSFYSNQYSQGQTGKANLEFGRTTERHKGMPITDAVFIIKQIKEKVIEYSMPAYICFIDLTMAFDRVRLGDILHILSRYRFYHAKLSKQCMIVRMYPTFL
mgnify:CR=1 FL=1